MNTRVENLNPKTKTRGLMGRPDVSVFTSHHQAPKG